MSSLDALAETLRQLFEARQERLAERLIDRCTRSALTDLMVSHYHRLPNRIPYVIRQRLHRRNAEGEKKAGLFIATLPPVFNTWCNEGRRAAIRSVLRELDDADMVQLSAQPKIDPEVASIMREVLVYKMGD
ncbi:hypothetical protein [Dyella tabacisoli]|uniref:Uncharacterized protein n=1 Tax=Dyella tabacisoli TaxID=2282381 RepID=A0A369UST7_9GAMM|nr:hypothetical protein [Dyella tabacisoli]RDD83115.1 hypothetical protein DVJ77_00395 [Dyella tabacisoli]